MRILNGPSRNRASTLRLTDIVTLQVPVPVHLRSQPLKEWPDFGVAVRVTVAPWLNCALHPVAATTPFVTVQLMPVGEDLTVPSPVPLPRIVSVLVTREAAPSVPVMPGRVLTGIEEREGDGDASQQSHAGEKASRRIGPPAKGTSGGVGI